MRIRVAQLIGAALAAAVLTSGCDWPKPTDAAAGGTDKATSSPAAAPAAAGTVWVEDATGQAWPVTEAVERWDNALTLSVRYGPCPDDPADGVRCVKVREGGFFPDDQIGRTSLFGSRNVRMNPDYASLPDVQRLAAVCHELGHALGLTEHNEDRDSCMNSKIGSGTSTSPGRRDVAELNAAGGGSR